MDELTLTLHHPLTDKEWDDITDVDFEHTNEITFYTKNGKEVVFAKKPRWIPVSEALPMEDEDVFVTVRYIERKTKKPKYYVDVARNYGGDWNSYSDEYKVSPSRHKVIAWKEMPEPYKPKEGEQSEID